MAQNININPISIGSSHDSSTTYTFTVDSGTVTLFGGDPATGISKSSLEAGIIITISDDNLIYATCTVDNGTCQGQTSIVYWFNGATGVWQTGGNLSYSRVRSGGAGEQLAALAFGGTGENSIYYSTSETYNGSVWSIGANLNNSRNATGTGSQNAALAIALRPYVNSTEEYNGTSWAIGGNLLISRINTTSTGVQNAALTIGENCSYLSEQVTSTEEYNGGTWSTAANTSTLRADSQGAGNVSSTLISGGYTNSTCTEEYNGVSWSSKAPLPQNICALGMSGVSNSTLAFGGLTSPGFNANSFKYDGTSWSTGNGLINIRYYLEGIGTKTAMAIGGGYPYRNQTEEYNELLTTSTTPTPPPTGTTPPSGVGVWSTAENYSTPRYRMGASGTQNSGLIFGGSQSPSRYSCTEEYNGTSWVAGGDLNNCRYGLGGAGTQNASIAFGGNISFSGNQTCSEIYDGNSWSNVGPLITGRAYGANVGTQNAALFAGGQCIGTKVSCTEEYNGISWITGASLSRASYNTSGAGTQNSALAVSRATEEYDGTVWSSGGSPNFITCQHGGAGTAQNYALAFGGYVSCTEEYDGGVWTLGGTFSLPSRLGAGLGSQSAALKMGGLCGATVEKYNK